MPATPLPFAGGEGIDGEGVQTFGELVGEEAMDGAMTLDARAALELAGDDEQAEVGLGAGRHVVQVALVADLEMARFEVPVKLVGDGLLYRHRSFPPGP